MNAGCGVPLLALSLTRGQMGTSAHLWQRHRAESRRRRGATPCLPFIAVVTAALVMASVVSAPAQTASPTPARVLLLHSFGQNFSPWNHISARFRAELVKQSARPIDLYEVPLQNVRVGESRDQETFLNYLRALFT